MRRILLLGVAVLTAMCLKGNAIEINNVQRLAAPSAGLISFELSWQNSWNVTGSPGNHDAAWVFIKYRECGTTGSWNHALLSTTLSDHTLDAGLTFADSISALDRLGNAGDHNTGALIRRSSLGTGHIVSLPCTLQVVGGAGGAAFLAATDYDIRVFGVEMVNIPEGEYALGDNGSTPDYKFRTSNVSTSPPVIVTSESPLPLYDGACGARTIPANFPKGYGSFYLMKYEISQGQYANFLNTLSGPVSTQRFPGFYGQYRHRITVAGGQYISERQDRACNYLDWNDILTYLDWAALRPMTELEYEKACKGSGPMAPNGFAWGTASLIQAENLSGLEDGTEMVTDSAANVHCYYQFTRDVVGGDSPTNSTDLTRGPIGCGIFARDATQTRETTGGSYFGVMELSGNVSEAVVTINGGTSSCVTNPAYDGIWGDGLLTGAGLWNTTNWPVAVTTSNTQVGLRGGSWDDGPDLSLVADRNHVRSPSSRLTTRTRTVGGRGVR